MKTKTSQMVLTSLLTAMVCVATMVIHIPTPTNGYVNLGDTVVLLSGWLLGPIWGFFAGGVGSAMADLLSGYTAYVPGTLMIKGFMATLAAVITTQRKHGTYMCGLSAITAEIWMVTGYFMYEAVVLGYGIGASASILGNVMQAITGLALSLGVYQMLKVAGVLNRI